MKLREQTFLFGFCFLFLSTFVVKAQIGIVDRDAKIKPTLVVLGTYHMGTPGNNVVNGKVDDVTSPERQKQMMQLVGRLKQFKPLRSWWNAISRTTRRLRKFMNDTYREAINSQETKPIK